MILVVDRNYLPGAFQLYQNLRTGVADNAAARVDGIEAHEFELSFKFLADRLQGDCPAGGLDGVPGDFLSVVACHRRELAASAVVDIRPAYHISAVDVASVVLLHSEGFPVHEKLDLIGVCEGVDFDLLAFLPVPVLAHGGLSAEDVVPFNDAPFTLDNSDMHQRLVAERALYKIRLGIRFECAVEEGIVVGGGAALLYATSVLDKVKTDNDEQKVGVDIVRRALQAPVRQIAENAGVDGAVIAGKLLEGNDQKIGFNAQTGEYTDMFAAGIIDPTKVVRSALEGAASIGGLLITTEAMVADKPEEKCNCGGPGAGAPGMGGMGGMDF